MKDLEAQSETAPPEKLGALYAMKFVALQVLAFYEHH